MNTYRAEWSGKCPNLCSGEWSLYRNGDDISYLIPKERRTIEMNTEKGYQQWSWDRNLDEVTWRTVYWGLPADEWIEENDVWLKTITTDQEEKKLVYLAFNEQDWALGSCGGCV